MVDYTGHFMTSVVHSSLSKSANITRNIFKTIYYEVKEDMFDMSNVSNWEKNEKT